MGMAACTADERFAFTCKYSELAVFLGGRCCVVESNERANELSDVIWIGFIDDDDLLCVGLGHICVCWVRWLIKGLNGHGEVPRSRYCLPGSERLIVIIGVVVPSANRRACAFSPFFEHLACLGVVCTVVFSDTIWCPARRVAGDPHQLSTAIDNVRKVRLRGLVRLSLVAFLAHREIVGRWLYVVGVSCARAMRDAWGAGDLCRVRGLK